MVQPDTTSGLPLSRKFPQIWGNVHGNLLKFGLSVFIALDFSQIFRNIPKRNNQELQKDVDQFCRTVRLKEFFHDKEDLDDRILRNKSTFHPEKDRNETLESYSYLLQSSVNNPTTVNRKKNYYD